MPAAFVLINAEIGAEEDVLQDLGKIENVEEAYVVVSPVLSREQFGTAAI